jgi:hypothetical protein
LTLTSTCTLYAQITSILAIVYFYVACSHRLLRDERPMACILRVPHGRIGSQQLSSLTWFHQLPRLGTIHKLHRRVLPSYSLESAPYSAFSPPPHAARADRAFYLRPVHTTHQLNGRPSRATPSRSMLTLYLQMGHSRTVKPSIPRAPNYHYALLDKSAEPKSRLLDGSHTPLPAVLLPSALLQQGPDCPSADRC